MAKVEAKVETNKMDPIMQDIKALKADLASLSKDMRAEGRITATNLKDKAQENITQLQDYSRDQLKNVESEIKAKPAQSVAIAFAAGAILSFLFRRG